MPDHAHEFHKDDIETYLKEVSKEYRKLVGKAMPAELVLVGGASVLINYGFRGMTTDIDALVQAASAMQDAIRTVASNHGLPLSWLNSDFMKTDSYSPKLFQYSTYYKTFSNVVTVRTIAAEYLVAMKLMAGRQYKNDLSDIIGILAAHEAAGTPLSLEQVKQAVSELYGNWSVLPEISQEFIEKAMLKGDYATQFAVVQNNEQTAKEMLIEIIETFPAEPKKSNAPDILATLKARLEE